MQDGVILGAIGVGGYPSGQRDEDLARVGLQAMHGEGCGPVLPGDTAWCVVKIIRQRTTTTGSIAREGVPSCG